MIEFNSNDSSIWPTFDLDIKRAWVLADAVAKGDLEGLVILDLRLLEADLDVVVEHDGLDTPVSWSDTGSKVKRV